MSEGIEHELKSNVFYMADRRQPRLPIDQGQDAKQYEFPTNPAHHKRRNRSYKEYRAAMACSRHDNGGLTSVSEAGLECDSEREESDNLLLRRIGNFLCRARNNSGHSLISRILHP